MKKDFFIILFTFYVYAILNGYPVLTIDSGRYWHGMMVEYCDAAPLFSMFIFKPFFDSYRFWGWFFCQAFLAALTLSLFKKDFFREIPAYVFSLIIILSMYGFVVLSLVADFYTLLGLLSLYAIIQGKKSWVYYVVFILSAAAHHGNTLLYFAIVFALVIIYRKNLMAYLKPLILILLAMVINGFYALKVGNVFNCGCQMGYTFVSARIMKDIPESIYSFAAAHKDSYIAANKGGFYKAATKKKDPGDILWRKASPIYEKLIEFNPEAKKYIVYTLANYPLEHIRIGVHNSFEFLFQQNITGYRYDPFDRWMVEIFDKKNLDVFDSSLFVNLQTIKYETSDLTKIIYLISLIFNGLIVLRYKNKNDIIYSLALFSILAVVINAIIMPNLSTGGPRYLLRVIPISMIPFLTNYYLILKDRFDFKQLEE